MWLVYLRFEDNEQDFTYFVPCEYKEQVETLVELAKQHGLTQTARLKEQYAIYDSESIELTDPNAQRMSLEAFLEQWDQVEADAS